MFINLTIAKKNSEEEFEIVTINLNKIIAIIIKLKADTVTFELEDRRIVTSGRADGVFAAVGQAIMKGEDTAAVDKIQMRMKGEAPLFIPAS